MATIKLNTYSRQAILRAIMADVPKPDRAARRTKVQAALVKAMTPECRKIYNRTPQALVSEPCSELYDSSESWNSRRVVLGDAPKTLLRDLLKEYEAQDMERYNVERNLKAVIDACSTIKQLETRLPEFKKYYPKEADKTQNLPALANLVADLTKLGWPKK